MSFNKIVFLKAIITIQSFLRGSKVRCGPERWRLMLWNLKRFIDKNGRLPQIYE
jgi:hypothetical protein